MIKTQGLILTAQIYMYILNYYKYNYFKKIKIED